MGSLTFKHSGDTRLTLGYTQDHLNRVGEITVTPSVSAATSYAYTYNSANQRTRITREDSRYWAYGYDALGQVDSAAKHLSNDDVISGTAFASTYDDIVNRMTTTRNGHSATYTANALNQYSQRTVPGYVDIFGTAASDATVTVNGATASRQAEYFFSSEAYDNAYTSWWTTHQITGLRAGGGPGGADAEASSERHAWLPQTPESFTYDADGNLLSDGRWTYTWDGENRLVAMETNEDILPPLSQFPLSQRIKLEFAYDSNGRRISKQVSKWSDSGWSLEHSTLFVYDGWNMIAELDALNSNTLTKTYAWGLDLSGSLQGAGGVGGLLMASSAGSVALDCAAACDANGNVVSYVNLDSGTTEAVYEYGAFGETALADGRAQTVFPFRFSTKFQDAETHLLYYGFRYYNPSNGRWLSRDPLEEEGGVNLYGFVDNNGVDMIDPLGRNGYTQGLLWLLGLAKDKHYGPSDFPTHEMQRSRVARIIRDKVRDVLRQYCKSGETGAKRIPIDVGLNKISPYAYPILFGVDLLTNSTAAFVGSFTTGEITATAIDCCKCEAQLHWHAINVSGTESASHKPPRAGKYGDALLKDDVFGRTGPMHTFTQTYDWDESFTYGPCK